MLVHECSAEKFKCSTFGCVNALHDCILNVILRRILGVSPRILSQHKYLAMVGFVYFSNKSRSKSMTRECIEIHNSYIWILVSDCVRHVHTMFAVCAQGIGCGFVHSPDTVTEIGVIKSQLRY